MRVLLLNQYYPPDLAPTGIYLHELARALVAAGHQVQVLAAGSAYAGAGDTTAAQPQHSLRDGVQVRRLPGLGLGSRVRQSWLAKLGDYLAYYVQAARAARLGRFDPDLIISLTTPPYLGLVGRWAARCRGAAHAHWVMDLYPDVLRAHGVLRGGLLLRLLGKLARVQFGGARAVLALGPCMAGAVGRYLPSRCPAAAIALWSLEGAAPWPADRPNALRAERGWDDGRLTLLYSGNLGRGHRFEDFLAAAKQLGADGPRWAFAGGGPRRAEVERFIAANPSLPVSLLPYAPASRLSEHLASADVHLASLDPSWDGCMVPSKLQGIFAIGRPALVVASPQSELGRWVRESGGGWVVAPGDVAGLVAAVRQAADPAQRQSRAAAAAAFAKAHFDRSTALKALLGAVAPGSGTPLPSGPRR